jgi:photosystem II stability/assembly factor-like uncharacterized protein
MGKMKLILRSTIFRYLLIILFLIISAPNDYSQWFWQNPLPQGNELYSVCFIDSLTGFAGGYPTLLLKTTDGGIHWFEQKDWKDAINNIYFLNKSIGFIVGGSTIFKTTDSGLNWIKQNTGSIYTKLYSICFVDSKNGYVVGNYEASSSGVVLNTTDGGENWDYQTINAANGLTDVFFTNDSTGYITGIDGIFKTTNGGNSWINQFNWTSYKGTAQSVYFTGIDTGYFATISGEIFKTTNGGLNWVNQLYVDTLSFNSIIFTEVKIGYVAGLNGEILKTTNGGNTWTVKASKTLEWFNQIHFQNENTGYVVGTHGIILKTTDSGESWFELSKGTRNNINAIYFPTTQTGFSTGNTGIILKTTNGGNDWIGKISGVPYNLNSIFFLDSLNGYAVGDSGTILKSSNGGEVWVKNGNGYFINYKSVWFTDLSTGYICGENGTVLKTTNGGHDWINQNTGIFYNLNTLFFYDNYIGYTAGDAGIIYKTTNGGIDWYQLITGYDQPIYSSYFINSDTGFVAGLSGILKTTDGGNTWNQKLFISIHIIYSLNFVYNKIGYACGSLKYKTTDGGETWVGFSTSADIDYKSVFFTDENTGYLGGPYGTILKTTNGGISSVSLDYDTTNPDGFYLYQNFPNPFNPSTRIRFSLPRLTKISLVIYDILGNKIKTLFEGEKEMGEYNFEFIPNDLASGIYIYQLITPDNVITNKMVFLK